MGGGGGREYNPITITMITANLASARRRTDFFRAAGEGVWPPALAREVPPGEGGKERLRGREGFK